MLTRCSRELVAVLLEVHREGLELAPDGGGTVGELGECVRVRAVYLERLARDGLELVNDRVDGGEPPAWPRGDRFSARASLAQGQSASCGAVCGAVTAAGRLREALADQRRRGVPFEDAWARARALALEGEHGPERQTWSVAIVSTHDAWEMAYHGGSAAGVKALHNVHELAGLEVACAVARKRTIPPRYPLDTERGSGRSVGPENGPGGCGGEALAPPRGFDGS